MRSLLSLLLTALALGLSACTNPLHPDSAKTGPFFTPKNVHGAPRLPDDFRRVAILPMAAAGADISEETLNKLDAIFLAELNRTAVFETTSVTRDELNKLFETRQITSVQVMPPGFLDHFFNVHNQYAADGILYLDVTNYSPYPPLKLGVRAKLARLRDGEIIWAADLVFSAAEPAVANSARRYTLQSGLKQSPGDLSHTILQNPSRFASYVANATYETLPPRVKPPQK